MGIESLARRSLILLWAVCSGCDEPAAAAAASAASIGAASRRPAGESVADPFDPESCLGAPLGLEDARGRFKPGSRVAPLGRYQIVARQRTCNRVSGCQAWQPAPVTTAEGTARLKIVSGRVILELVASQCGPRWAGASCGTVEQSSVDCGLYTRARGPRCERRPMTLGGPKQRLDFKGVVTRQCLRQENLKRVDLRRDGSQWKELDAAVLVRY